MKKGRGAFRGAPSCSLVRSAWFLVRGVSAPVDEPAENRRHGRLAGRTRVTALAACTGKPQTKNLQRRCGSGGCTGFCRAVLVRLWSGCSDGQDGWWWMVDGWIWQSIFTQTGNEEHPRSLLGQGRRFLLSSTAAIAAVTAAADVGPSCCPCCFRTAGAATAAAACGCLRAIGVSAAAAAAVCCVPKCHISRQPYPGCSTRLQIGVAGLRTAGLANNRRTAVWQEAAPVAHSLPQVQRHNSRHS